MSDVLNFLDLNVLIYNISLCFTLNLWICLLIESPSRHGNLKCPTKREIATRTKQPFGFSSSYLEIMITSSDSILQSQISKLNVSLFLFESGLSTDDPEQLCILDASSMLEVLQRLSILAIISLGDSSTSINFNLNVTPLSKLKEMSFFIYNLHSQFRPLLCVRYKQKGNVERDAFSNIFKRNYSFSNVSFSSETKQGAL